MFLSYIQEKAGSFAKSVLHVRKSRAISSAFFLLISMIFCCSLHENTLVVHATYEELAEEAEERKSLPIQSNDIENWPAGPAISAESAILMDIDTGSIL